MALDIAPGVNRRVKCVDVGVCLEYVTVIFLHIL